MPKISDVILVGSEELHVFDTPILLTREYSLSMEQRFIKRSIDVICSLILLVVTSPLMLLTALAIKLYDGGSVLYKQVRCTTGQREFYIMKFRSMRTDAEKDGVAQWASQLPTGTRVAFGTSREQLFNLHTQETWTGSVLASLGLNVPAAMAGASMPSIGLEQLLAVNPAWLLVAHYREESIVKRWQQDPLWQMLTAAQKQQVASVDSNTWARMRGIFAAERIAADTVKIFHHQPLTVVK